MSRDKFLQESETNLVKIANVLANWTKPGALSVVSCSQIATVL